MNTTAKLALGAAAVVVVALLGINFLLLGGSRVGGPDSTITPTPTPTPMPIRADNTELQPGTYVTSPFEGRSPMRIVMTLPAGWSAFNEFAFIPVGEGSSEDPDGMAMGFFLVDGLYSDPCFAEGAPDIAVGPTVDDLANAFLEQTAYEVTGPEDVTLAGYAGKRVDLALPSDLDADSCGYEDYVVWPGSPYSQGPGNLWQVWILDVEGTRVVILANNFEGTSPEDLAEQQRILDSIRIEP